MIYDESHSLTDIQKGTIFAWFKNGCLYNPMSNSLTGHHERLINLMENMRSDVKGTAGSLTRPPTQK
jgi:hypothetical protein